ncbi:MAG: hypothetical protein ACLFWM_06185 [Actinomycetota bacterium]
MRRAHPFLLIAVWAVLALLAVAGFAAFQTQGREIPQASFQSLGREVGAMAGLGFNAPRSQVVAVPASPSEDADGETQSPDDSLTSEELLASAEAESEGEAEEADPVETIPTHGWLSEMQVRALIARYFPPEDVNRAIRIAWCQSRFNPTSVNPETGGTGLFHHLPEFWPQRARAVGLPDAEPTDPEANVAAAAHAIYEEGGWSVFNCVS